MLRTNAAGTSPADHRAMESNPSKDTKKNSGLAFLATFLVMVLIGTAICLRNMEIFSNRDLAGRQSSVRSASATVMDGADANSTATSKGFSNAAASEQEIGVIDKDIDWSDTIFQHFESDNDPVVLESHKLLFFTIPKNSCTEWKQLFRRMMGYDNWNKMPFLHPHDPRTNGLSYLGTYDKAKQEEFMTSPEWTRAMFVRDPMERMLSAYLNKGLSEERYIKKWCCNIFPRDTDKERQQELEYLQEHNPSCVPLVPWESQPTAETFTFDTFINDFMLQCNDKHWRPQSQRMHTKNWKFLNFIGRMENLHEDAKSLLQKIGAWEEFGSNGWGQYENMSMFERARSDTTNTHSRDHIAQYYTPELKRKALEYLKDDYQNEWLNFSLPEDVDESIL